MSNPEFKLERLVEAGFIKPGDPLYYTEDPSRNGKLVKTKEGLQIKEGEQYYTPWRIILRWVGQDPLDVPIRWIKTKNGDTLLSLWNKYLQTKVATSNG